MSHNEKHNKEQMVDIRLLKKEVDSLQIAFESQQTPWFKNITVYISIAAFLLSLGTTYIGWKRTKHQDIKNNRIELRGLLQRMATLPKENLELIKKYEEQDPTAIAAMGSLINQENLLLVHQAAEIVRELPEKRVSSIEHYAIGVAMQSANSFVEANMCFTKAIKLSKNVNERVGSLRSRAHLLFLTGQPEAGRNDYLRALGVFSEFNHTLFNDFTIKSTHIYTELAWAISEANMGRKMEALTHVVNAEKYLSGLVKGPGVNLLSKQIQQTRAMLINSEITPDSTRRLPLQIPIPITGFH